MVVRLSAIRTGSICITKSKAVPLQAWRGPEGSWKLRFPDFVTTAQDGGKVVSLTHRPPHLPSGNTHGTHFCSRLSRPQGHSASRRIYVNEKFHDTGILFFINQRDCLKYYRRIDGLFLSINNTSSRPSIYTALVTGIL
jgi:hypothetical protein